jgi:hypothetical protein
MASFLIVVISRVYLKLGDMAQICNPSYLTEIGRITIVRPQPIAEHSGRCCSSYTGGINRRITTMAESKTLSPK